MIAEWTYSSKVFSTAVVKRGLMIQHIEKLPELQKAYKSLQVSYQIVGCRNVECNFPYRCKFDPTIYIGLWSGHFFTNGLIYLLMPEVQSHRQRITETFL